MTSCSAACSKACAREKRRRAFTCVTWPKRYRNCASALAVTIHRLDAVSPPSSANSWKRSDGAPSSKLMTPPARLSAAIEIFADIEARRQPAVEVLKDWGLAHRFAGSGDRAGIAGLVYDALRQRASSSWRLGEDNARAHVLGALAGVRGLGLGEIAALFSGERHAPEPLTEVERDRLPGADLAGAPDHVRGDYPEWLAPAFAESFGDEA